MSCVETPVIHLLKTVSSPVAHEKVVQAGKPPGVDAVLGALNVLKQSTASCWTINFVNAFAGGGGAGQV